MNFLYNHLFELYNEIYDKIIVFNNSIEFTFTMKIMCLENLIKKYIHLQLPSNLRNLKC